MKKSRAFTEEEVREQILDHMRQMCKYWSDPAQKGNRDTQQLMESLCFSILNVFDGTTATLPAFDIVCAPHPTDKSYCKEHGENWYEPGMIVNNCTLHDQWYAKQS